MCICITTLSCVVHWIPSFNFSVCVCLLFFFILSLSLFFCLFFSFFCFSLMSYFFWTGLLYVIGASLLLIAFNKLSPLIAGKCACPAKQSGYLYVALWYLLVRSSYKREGECVCVVYPSAIYHLHALLYCIFC